MGISDISMSPISISISGFFAALHVVGVVVSVFFLLHHQRQAVEVDVEGGVGLGRGSVAVAGLFGGLMSFARSVRVVGGIGGVRRVRVVRGVGGIRVDWIGGVHQLAVHVSFHVPVGPVLFRQPNRPEAPVTDG